MIDQREAYFIWIHSNEQSFPDILIYLKKGEVFVSYMHINKLIYTKINISNVTKSNESVKNISKDKEY